MHVIAFALLVQDVYLRVIGLGKHLCMILCGPQREFSELVPLMDHLIMVAMGAGVLVGRHPWLRFRGKMGVGATKQNWHLSQRMPRLWIWGIGWLFAARCSMICRQFRQGGGTSHFERLSATMTVGSWHHPLSGFRPIPDCQMSCWVFGINAPNNVVFTSCSKQFQVINSRP